ncbi:MAG: ParA family protein [Lachnospiraceae bacterium]|nr:ParA family protein [Lachnospiraceae bacterium]
MCKVISVSNNKGGVAKTTTTCNLGVGLARSGKRVLIIDTDPQGNLTCCMGIREPDELDYTIADAMARIINEEFIDPHEGIIPCEEGVDLMPGNIELSGLESSLISVTIGRESILKDFVDMLRDDYDYILIDCMPSLGLLTVNAMMAADSLLIPMEAEYLSAKGLNNLLKTVTRIRRLNADLTIDGILLTKVSGRTNYEREIREKLDEGYAKNIRIFTSSIPRSVRASEQSALGISIYRHDPRGKIAAAYQSLTEEVLAS